MLNMVKKIKLTIISLLITTISLCAMPVSALNWEATNLSLSNIKLEGNSIVSFDLSFDLPDYLGDAVSWISLQKAPFNDDADLTDFGDIWGTYRFSNFSDVLSNQTFTDNYRLVGIYPDNSDGFPSFGDEHTHISQSFNVPSIPLDQADDYYIYLWTRLDFFNQFYPDAPLGKLTASGSGDINLYESSDQTNEVETHYGITFNTDGGSNIPSQIVLELGTANEPETPTKEGFIFKGWYSNSELTEAFDFTTPITEPINLYAKWEEEGNVKVPNTGANTENMSHLNGTNNSLIASIVTATIITAGGMIFAKRHIKKIKTKRSFTGGREGT